jgi:hypothetical protein
MSPRWLPRLAYRPRSPTSQRSATMMTSPPLPPLLPRRGWTMSSCPQRPRQRPLYLPLYLPLPQPLLLCMQLRQLHRQPRTSPRLHLSLCLLPLSLQRLQWHPSLQHPSLQHPSLQQLLLHLQQSLSLCLLPLPSPLPRTLPTPRRRLRLLLGLTLASTTSALTSCGALLLRRHRKPRRLPRYVVLHASMCRCSHLHHTAFIAPSVSLFPSTLSPHPLCVFSPKPLSCARACVVYPPVPSIRFHR